MEISKPNREIPERIREYFYRLSIEGYVALHVGNHKRAKESFEKQYALLLAAQKEEDRGIHKGHPLYNLGLSLFYLGETDEGIRHILLAYVEDALNEEYGFEDDADRLPAARVLRDLFFFRLRILREINLIVEKVKGKGQWNDLRNPQVILEEVAKGGFDLSKPSSLCQRIPVPGKVLVGFPQPIENRVFIGTNYDVNIGVIPLIKEGVIRRGKGYVPVTVLDVHVPPNATHDISLLLLHTCAHAIIDVSHPGGQFIEIERTRDYKTNVLLVRQATKPVDPKKPPHISEMISTLGYPIRYYFDPRELIQITMKWLP